MILLLGIPPLLRYEEFTKKTWKKVNPKVYALEIIGNRTHRQDGYPIHRVPFVKRRAPAPGPCGTWAPRAWSSRSASSAAAPRRRRRPAWRIAGDGRPAPWQGCWC